MNKFFGTSLLEHVVMILMMLLIFIALVMIIFCCKYLIIKRCPGFFQKIVTKIQSKLFWNSLLRACLEVYYSMAIFFFYLVARVDSKEQDGRVEFMTWFLTGVLLFGFPVFTFKLLFSKWRILWREDVRSKFDSLYQNVDVYKGPIAFAFTLYFCARRLVFALVIG